MVNFEWQRETNRQIKELLTTLSNNYNYLTIYFYCWCKAKWAEYGPRVVVCSRLISTKPDPEHNAASPKQMKNDFFQVGRGPTRSRNRCFMHQSQTHYCNSSLVNRTRREMLPSCVQISRVGKLLCREHFTYHSHNIPFTQPSKDVPCDGKQGGAVHG